jgi:hypothetical protein
VVVYPPLVNRTGIRKIEIRGFNIRPTFIPAFIHDPKNFPPLDPEKDDGLINALRDTVTADDESMAGLFYENDFYNSEAEHLVESSIHVISFPAEDVPIAVIDGERGTVISAPEPLTWPNLRKTREPIDPDEVKNSKELDARWANILRDEQFSNVPAVSLKAPDPELKDDDTCDPPEKEHHQPARRNGPAKKAVKKAAAKRVSGRIR